MAKHSRLRWGYGRRVGAVLLVLAWGWGGYATAAAVEGLYQAEVPVASQAAAERGAALRAALEQVLMKVTGRRNLGSSAAWVAALKRADQWVQSYHYAPLPPEAPAEVLPGGKAASQYLVVMFYSHVIQDTLRQAGWAVWGKERPLVFTALALDDGTTKTVVDDVLPGEVRGVVARTAQRRGLPVRLPLAADAQPLHFAEISGLNQEILLGLAASHQSTVVLAGRLQRKPIGAWSGRYGLFQVGIPALYWDASGELNDVLRAGVEGAADALAKRYALMLSATADNRVLLTVSKVTTADQYAQTLRYVQTLDGVEKIDILRVEADRILFRLATRATREGLVQTIGLGRILERGDGAVTEEELSYRLLP